MVYLARVEVTLKAVVTLDLEVSGASKVMQLVEQQDKEVPLEDLVVVMVDKVWVAILLLDRK